MGEVRENITLRNAGDVINFQRGLIKETEVRQVTSNMVADTGAWTIILSEETARKLGLFIKDRHSVTVAGGDKKTCFVGEPVEIRWKDRYMTMEPLILPGEKEDLLGALPLEGMDLMVDPARQRIVGAHGEEWVCYVRRADRALTDLLRSPAPGSQARFIRKPSQGGFLCERGKRFSPCVREVLTYA